MRNKAVKFDRLQIYQQELAKYGIKATRHTQNLIFLAKNISLSPLTGIKRVEIPIEI